jgi:hypothetical protein
MNKSVPTLLGIVIILLVVVLAVLIVNYKTTKGLGEGKELVGTVGGEILMGEEAPEEFIDTSTVTGSREPEPVEARQFTSEQRARQSDRRQEVQAGRDERRAEREGAAPGAGE